MPIRVQLDAVLARRGLRSRELAARIGISEVNLSLLKTGRVKGMRFETLSRICAVLECQPGDLLQFEPGPEDPLPAGATTPV